MSAFLLYPLAFFQAGPRALAHLVRTLTPTKDRP